MWTGTDTRLVVTTALVVALVVVLITSRLRLHAFPGLMTDSLVLGLAAGPGPTETVEASTDGAGGTLGDVGVVLGLGTTAWSVMETIVSVVGLVVVLAASLVV